MNSITARKLAVSGVLIAVGVVCSPLCFPVGAAKCFPIQHLINIMACRIFRTALRRDHGFSNLGSAAGSRHGHNACFSRQYVRRTYRRSLLQADKKTAFRIHRRAYRHRHYRRVSRVSYHRICHGKRMRRFRIHNSLYHKLGGWHNNRGISGNGHQKNTRP